MITEAILTAIVDAVIGYIVEKRGDKLSGQIREKLGRDPLKKAFKESLAQAFAHLSKEQPDWVANNFDASFFQFEGAPLLAEFLLMDGRPDASELANRWADSLNVRNPEQRTLYISELEPVALDFLEELAHQLKGQEALRELNNSRALDQATEALQSLRQRLGADKATKGTYRDYLNWLIARNFYLDPRGTFQTQRQVQVKLNEVYISLQAQPDETLGVIERQNLEKELADLEAEYTTTELAAVELEDKRDLLQARFEKRLSHNKPTEVLELSEVIKRYAHVVILGDPGSGKSTLLRYLALENAQKLRDSHITGKELGNANFPILIRIAEYADNGIWKRKSLSEFLSECFRVHDCPPSGLADLLQSQLDKGDCLVLLDGLDEIVSADERLGVVRQIEDFIRRYNSKNHHFVVTSRIAGYRSASLGELFTHYTVREMNEEQIQRFLERWCQAIEDAQTPELPAQQRQNTAKREIDGILNAIQNPGVRRLAANPLLLRILALIHRTGAKLPQKRIELYKLAADTLARTWRTAQGVSEKALDEESALLKEEYLTPLLSRLAYWLHDNKPTGIATEREVYTILGEEWARLNEIHWDADDPNPKIREEVRKFLVAVHEHTGLFVERAPKRYGFMHLTFEEYYVARYLVARRKKCAKLIRQHLHQSRWEEPILLALGFIGLEYPADASELLETAILAKGEEAIELGITCSSHEDLLGRDFLFALRSLGDNIPVRPKLLNQLLERLADELLFAANAGYFDSYREALYHRLSLLEGNEGSSTIIPLLIRGLSNTDSKVRIRAVESLSLIGKSSPQAVDALLAALKDTDQRVRISVVESVGLFSQYSPIMMKVLLIALKDRSADVRTNAADSLDQIDQIPLESVSSLLAVLKDRTARVRAGVAESLGQVGQGSPEVVNSLLVALKDRNAQVCASAARSLGQVGQGSPKASKGLLAALKDNSPQVRNDAARSLVQIGFSSPEAVDRLLTALRDRNAQTRVRITESLGQVGQTSPEVVHVLLTTLKDRNAQVRASAARSLERIGFSSPEVIDGLLATFNDKIAQVRATVAESLGRVGQGSPKASKGLLAALKDNSPQVRASAARSLGQVGQTSPEVIDSLLIALQDFDPYVSANAAGSLGKMDQASAEDINILLMALKNSDAQVRANAARSLGLVGHLSPNAIITLIGALNDTDELVNFRAASSLEQIDQIPPEAVTPLTIALKNIETYVDSDFIPKFVRVNQATPELIVALQKLVREAKSWTIRCGAAQALGKISQGEQLTIDSLWHGILDKDNDVRSSCIEALIELGKRQPIIGQHLEEQFVQAIKNPIFQKQDKVRHLPAYDYVYHGLQLFIESYKIDSQLKEVH